jgi:hypothetical protein
MSTTHEDPQELFTQRADPEAMLLAMAQLSAKAPSDGPAAQRFATAIAKAVTLGMGNRNARIGVCEVKTAFNLK